MKIEYQSEFFRRIEVSGREYGQIKFSEIIHDRVFITG